MSSNVQFVRLFPQGSRADGVGRGPGSTAKFACGPSPSVHSTRPLVSFFPSCALLQSLRSSFGGAQRAPLWARIRRVSPLTQPQTLQYHREILLSKHSTVLFSPRPYRHNMRQLPQNIGCNGMRPLWPCKAWFPGRRRRVLPPCCALSGDERGTIRRLIQTSSREAPH